MSLPEKSLPYRLDLQETAASTGYFAAIPQAATTIEDGLAYLRRHPTDSFMYTHLLGGLGVMDLDAALQLLESQAGRDPIVRALLLEAALVYDQLSALKKSRCFRFHARVERVNALLADYRARGIHLQFPDISPAYGIPCCTCFVTHRDGTVAKGGGANLSGKRAVLASLTETPYPYPSGPPSAPVPQDLPWLLFEDLPDFSTGSPGRDLMLVEKTLLANGFRPIYVDITRKDLQIPVLKALVPDFEMVANFDHTCLISPRLFNNYLKIHSKQQ